MNDPFSTTAELARERSRGIERGFETLGAGAGAIASKMEEQQKQKTTLDLMKRFGIYKEEEIPYTVDEMKQIAEEKMGKKIELNPNLLPEEKMATTAKWLTEGLGIKLPKRTKIVVDPKRAEELRGFEFAEGKLGYKAPTTTPTIGVYTASPEGGLTQTGTVPKGAKVLTPTQLQTPEQKMEQTVQQENLKVTGGIKRALKGFENIQKQFNEALPTKEGNEYQTRLAGIGAVLGAKTGVKANPKLLALAKNGKLYLRPIMRGLGEGARMSDQDIDQAVSSIQMEGQSPEEREAIVKSFAEFAVSQMDEVALNMLKKDKLAMSMLNILGVDLGNESNETQTNKVGRFMVEVE